MEMRTERNRPLMLSNLAIRDCHGCRHDLVVRAQLQKHGHALLGRSQGALAEYQVSDSLHGVDAWLMQQGKGMRR
jgi:hypothetical protein